MPATYRSKASRFDLLSSTLKAKFKGEQSQCARKHLEKNHRKKLPAAPHHLTEVPFAGTSNPKELKYYTLDAMTYVC
jgi:hypothetical protein